MSEVTASRTLVKSAPELWTECSDPQSLARHLDRFGEIRIVRLEPETAVAWEGERASGTVRLQPSGWGTRVVITATPAPALTAPPSAAATPAAEAVAPAPPSGPVTPDGPPRGRWRRLRALLRRSRRQVPPAPEAAVAEHPIAPEPDRAPSTGDLQQQPSATDVDVAPVLDAALDSLGRAHHRPFSRA